MSGSTASTCSVPHASCKNSGDTQRPRPSLPATGAPSEFSAHARDALQSSGGSPVTASSSKSTLRSAPPSRCLAMSRSRTAQYGALWSSAAKFLRYAAGTTPLAPMSAASSSAAARAPALAGSPR
eukprot:6193609-Pleurochrysis_carterae.AAC.2